MENSTATIATQEEAMVVLPGEAYPLGAYWTGNGVNFSVYSQHATAVELCLFDEHGAETRLTLPSRSHNIFYGYVNGLEPGQRYGYRVHGPYDPQNGHRFNPSKLLLDPYTKAVSGEVEWNESLFGYQLHDPEQDLSYSTLNNAAFMPKSVVVDDEFDWQGDEPPRIAYRDSIMYELHVKGFTQLWPDIPDEIRGSYSALAHPNVIQYFKNLGVTAIELLPVHAFLNDHNLVQKGLCNYWGYNTHSFFAPEAKYSSSGCDGQQVTEFKAMVRELHKANIEVILDVVFNHTAEGNHMGPTLNFKGFDNATYYRLVSKDKRYYMDYTGTGNTLNSCQPAVLRLIMDSLRYWITEMHVDGFRFDLAAALGRGKEKWDEWSSFFNIIFQDPVISQVKLIAEPWDVGKDGNNQGRFPVGWAEWNGKFRDCVRRFWAGSGTTGHEFIHRFMGSADLYKQADRTPFASVNFVTVHDGFTMEDLVSYEQKHNEANGDNNEDGDKDNASINYGVEGPTDDPAIRAMRLKHKKNLLCTLFLSQGIPILLAGDEIGRTQQGNNNGYCQDNEISWVNWSQRDEELQAFVKSLIRLRKEHPVFARPCWFNKDGEGEPEIDCFDRQGQQLDPETQRIKIMPMLVMLNGHCLHFCDDEGQPVRDRGFLIFFNPFHTQQKFVVPEGLPESQWQVVVQTDPEQTFNATDIRAGEPVRIKAHSILVLMN